MKSKQDLIKFKGELEEKFGPCRVLTANQNTTLTNAINTNSRNDFNGFSWIEYWRAMTCNYDTNLFCCSCGKAIYVGDVPEVLNKLYEVAGDKPENHKACGGHVLVQPAPSGKYPGGLYIAPLCPACNAKHGDIIPIRKGTKICKEMGAHIREGE